MCRPRTWGPDEDDVRTQVLEEFRRAEVRLRRIVLPGTASAGSIAVAGRASPSKRYVVNVAVNLNLGHVAFGSPAALHALMLAKMMLHYLGDLGVAK